MSTFDLAIVLMLFLWTVSALGMLVIYCIAYLRFIQLTGYATPRLGDVSVIGLFIATMPVLNTLAFVLTIYLIIKNKHVLDRRVVLLLSKPLVDQDAEFSSSFI